MMEDRTRHRYISLHPSGSGIAIFTKEYRGLWCVYSGGDQPLPVFQLATPTRSSAFAAGPGSSCSLPPWSAWSLPAPPWPGLVSGFCCSCRAALAALAASPGRSCPSRSDHFNEHPGYTAPAVVLSNWVSGSDQKTVIKRIRANA